MKLKMVVVDLELPPRARRWGLRVGVCALVLGGSVVVLADSPLKADWATGDTLTAADLNGNFKAIDQRLSAMESTTAGLKAVTAPTGTIVAFGALVAPDGWLVCDGTAVDRTAYKALYAVVGEAWGDGGDGAGPLFSLPDLRGRALVGLGAAAEVVAMGGTDALPLASRSPMHAHVIAAEPDHTHQFVSAVGKNSGQAAIIHPGDPTLNNPGSYTLVGTPSAYNVDTSGGAKNLVERWIVTTSASGAHSHSGATGPSTTGYAVVQYVIKI